MSGLLRAFRGPVGPKVPRLEAEYGGVLRVWDIPSRTSTVDSFLVPGDSDELYSSSGNLLRMNMPLHNTPSFLDEDDVIGEVSSNPSPLTIDDNISEEKSRSSLPITGLTSSFSRASASPKNPYQNLWSPPQQKAAQKFPGKKEFPLLNKDTVNLLDSTSILHGTSIGTSLMGPFTVYEEDEESFYSESDEELEPPPVLSDIDEDEIVNMFIMDLEDKKKNEIPKRNWTNEFQNILQCPLKERGTKLHQLSEDFVSMAKTYGQSIIKERSLPFEEKTIKPLKGLGSAGGEKYMVDNIFFKFAVDTEDMYPSNQEAMKVAGHELKGLTGLVSCGMILGLSFPLLALIDYRGFRLTATSVLPISKDTLVYGSCDGGNEVHNESTEMNFKMEKIAKILNLKGHFTGLTENKKWIYGPCDIEGHAGTDGKLYILDTARIWPPEDPDRSLKGGFLFQLLRGELVSKYPVPLNSDAFTLFAEHDAEEHNAEARDATVFLHRKVIPEFAALLNNWSGVELTCNGLVEELHRAGINIRHLGRVRNLLIVEEVTSLVLAELVSRVLKNELRAEMRKLQSGDDFERLVYNFFHLAFGDSRESKRYWSIRVRMRIVTQYHSSALLPEEKQDPFDIRTRVDLQTVFERTQALTGVKYANHTVYTNITHDALEGIYVKAKYMYAVPRIEGDTLTEIAATSEDPKEALILFNAACEKYRSVLELKPDDHNVLQNVGTVLADMGRLSFNEGNVIATEGFFAQAYDKFEASLVVRPEDPKALQKWGNALSAHASMKATRGHNERANILFNRASENYEKATNSPYVNDPDIFYNWGNQLRSHAKLLVKMGRFSEAEEQLLQSVEKYRMCMSWKNEQPVLAVDSLINWGCALLRLGKLHDKVEAENYFGAAEEKFRKASGLIKQDGALPPGSQQEKEYLDILDCNLTAAGALSGQCIKTERKTTRRRSSWYSSPGLSLSAPHHDATRSKRLRE